MAKRKDPNQKNEYGSGSVYPNADGSFTAAVRPRKGTKPIRKRAATRAAAEAIRARLVEERDAGVNIEKGSQAVEDFTAYWFGEVYLQRGRSERQDKHTLDMLELHILPTLSKRVLMEVEHEECQQLINDLRRRPKPKKPLSAQTVHHVYSVLHQVFSLAFAMGYTRRDPSDKIELPEIKRTKKPAPTLERVRRLLTVIDPHPTAIVFHLMITLGLRLGEALGVRRADFNADFSELKINQALNYHTSKAGAPKRDSERLLAVPTHLQARCKAHWAAVVRQQEDAPDFANRGIFCPSETGTPIQPRNFERVWAGQTKNNKFYPGMKQKAGFADDAVLHDLRAFTATMLVDTEAPAVVVGQVLGHGAKNVTEHYMRRYIPTLRRALEKFEAVLWEHEQDVTRHSEML